MKRRPRIPEHYLLRRVISQVYGRGRRWCQFAVRGGYRPRSLWEAWGGTYRIEPGRTETGPEHELLAEFICQCTPALIIEVGCGFGRNLRFLRDHLGPDTTLVGVDLASSMLEQAKTYTSGAQLVMADIRALPFRTGSAGAVVTHGVLMHVPPADVQVALSEVARVGRTSFHIEEVRRVRRQGRSRRINPYTFAHDYRTALNQMTGTVVTSWSKDGSLLRFSVRHR